MKTRISWVCDEKAGSIDESLIEFDRSKYARYCIIRFFIFYPKVDAKDRTIKYQIKWEMERRVRTTHRAIRCEESVGVKEIARRQGSREL